MKRYYFVEGSTVYDGLEFNFDYVCERNIPLGKQLTIKEIIKNIIFLFIIITKPPGDWISR